MKTTLRILVLLAAMAPQFANACSACMGDPNSNVAKGANGAIFLMLGLLACVFLLLGAFAFQLYRCSRRPIPPHVELSDADAQPSSGLS
jgi:hypothetical protein